MLRSVFGVACLGSLACCGLSRTIDHLQDEPPPEFGRPAWVRTSAGVGAWIGGVAGGVVSIVALPITWPISLLAGDNLGGEVSKQEFLLLPMTSGAAIGHFLLGAPTDAVDFVFRRAWVGSPQPGNTYDLIPMEPPSSYGMSTDAPLPTEGPKTPPAAGEPNKQ
jgi:hypothetical protein